MGKKLRGKLNKSTSIIEQFLQEIKPKSKKEKIRNATAAYYAAGYGLETSKKMAKARVKKQYPKHKR